MFNNLRGHCAADPKSANPASKTQHHHTGEGGEGRDGDSLQFGVPVTSDLWSRPTLRKLSETPKSMPGGVQNRYSRRAVQRSRDGHWVSFPLMPLTSDRSIEPMLAIFRRLSSLWWWMVPSMRRCLSSMHTREQTFSYPLGGNPTAGDRIRL